tara:strand:+ start:355 stop:927 length:573 start_codon:yes stop_codon:yes gene_type:complete
MAIVIDGSSAAGLINLGSNGTITNLAAGGLPDDSVALADLSATGTASSSTFLRGDNSWAAPSGVVKKFQVDEYGGGSTTITASSYTDTGHSVTRGGNGGSTIVFLLVAQISNSYSTNIIPHYSIKLNDNSNTSGAFEWRQNQYDAGGQNMLTIVDYHSTTSSTTFKVRGYQSGGTSTQYITGATLITWEI